MSRYAFVMALFLAHLGKYAELGGFALHDIPRNKAKGTPLTLHLKPPTDCDSVFEIFIYLFPNYKVARSVKIFTSDATSIVRL